MIGVRRPVLATVGPDQPLRLQLIWTARDPFVVVMDIYPAEDAKPKRWCFDVTLLETAVNGLIPAGMGDIRLDPTSPTHTEILLAALSPERLALRVDTVDLAEFLAAIGPFEPVPMPDHLGDIDFGEELAT